MVASVVIESLLHLSSLCLSKVNKSLRASMRAMKRKNFDASVDSEWKVGRNGSLLFFDAVSSTLSFSLAQSKPKSTTSQV